METVCRVAVETKQEFHEWLRTQPLHLCVLIAARAAARVFPIITNPYAINAESSLLALFLTKCTLISGAQARLQAAGLRNRASRAYLQTADVSRYDSETGYAEASNSCVLAALAAAELDYGQAYSATDTAADAMQEVFGAGSCKRTFAATFIDTELDFGSLLQTPIWHQPKEPDWFSNVLRSRPNY